MAVQLVCYTKRALYFGETRTKSCGFYGKIKLLVALFIIKYQHLNNFAENVFRLLFP